MKRKKKQKLDPTVGNVVIMYGRTFIIDSYQSASTSISIDFILKEEFERRYKL